MSLEIITLKSPERFTEFVAKLSLRLKTSPCRTDDYNAFHVLKSMGGDVDVLETLKYLRSRGGYCDCEIMMNAVPWDGQGGIDFTEPKEEKA